MPLFQDNCHIATQSGTVITRNMLIEKIYILFILPKTSYLSSCHQLSIRSLTVGIVFMYLRVMTLAVMSISQNICYVIEIKYGVQHKTFISETEFISAS